MTLDELLALLPDNTTGEISAADLRTVVTELFGRASTIGQSFAYEWVNNPAPASGKISLNAGWSTASTTLLVSETTADGAPVPFGILDDNPPSRVILATAAGAKLHADITGPSVDQGSYRSIPVTVASAVGTVAAADKVPALFLGSIP